ncbi:hypothetical protein HKX48_005004 [Thoreauomyces humboldtii]|nr:hypothetical protein HKX48_005004 [Thoreauomyces humboldtii]
MGCPNSIAEAVVTGEIPITSILKDKGFKVDHLMVSATAEPLSCEKGDMNFAGSYYGMSCHPYELVFIKTNRGIDDNAIAHYTKWHGNMLGLKNSCPYYISSFNTSGVLNDNDDATET